MQISYDDDPKCITGVVQASMRNKSYAVEFGTPSLRKNCHQADRAASSQGRDSLTKYPGKCFSRRRLIPSAALVPTSSFGASWSPVTSPRILALFTRRVLAARGKRHPTLHLNPQALSDVNPPTHHGQPARCVPANT
ncbi:hypothetical protein HPB47_013461 [Ixodes persulcatus]|uniref:Uncharacterized protein n=1 Tax=Ixodes persulcatus TaxID=34615 RepID=A0AC60QYF6_IXOPE|nr:hypothetical protein HPB47_013461 [Ixodes persulcatus]